jgi:hypothetical protein
MVVLRRILALAAIAAATLLLSACERKITRVEVVNDGPQSCFECHSDTNTFLVAAEQQWEHSRHASGSTLHENENTCKNCHTSEGFVARAATGTSFSVSTTGVIENPTAIHCFTCHSPHSDGDFRLRWTALTTLANGTTADLGAGNLCAACHQSRRNIKTYITATTKLTERFGPHHGPQGDLLIGTNGYEYASYDYERSTHGTATDDGCLDCHMRTTSRNVVGGHSFNMEWTEGAEEVKNVAGCVRCHSTISEDTGFDYNGVQTEIDLLIQTLEDRLIGVGFLTQYTPGGDWMPDSTAGPGNNGKVSADSAGAVWNYLIAKEDRSHGVHNPGYIKGLLESSIEKIPAVPTAAAPPLAGAVRVRRD